MWLLLKGGRVIDPSQGIDDIADVLVRDGVIAGTGKIELESMDGAPGEVYDVTGKVVAPGLIDMHVHLREPGDEHKETIATGAAAAAAGGFTTIVAMPNTHPAPDSRAVVDLITTEGKKTRVNVLCCGALTKNMAGEEMAELGEIVEAGAVAASDDGFPIQNSLVMRRVMEYAGMLNIPVLVHCEDKALTAGAVMNEGIVSTVVGLRGMPAAAEVSMIERNILLAELAGCRLHIQHVSCAASVDVIRLAKARGVKVTCETCPQYFTLTDEVLADYDTNTKMNPPLRTAADVEAIKAGLADGTIDVIATDHAPHSLEDKEVEMTVAAFGIVGLETALPLVVTKLVDDGVMSLSDAIEKLTARPAEVLGINRGTLDIGAPADIVVFDPEEEITVQASKFKSMGRNTPFDGWKLKGAVIATIAGGKVAYGKLGTESKEQVILEHA
ncbi:MAG: dihydroorotase [Armatimonadota bacterium]